MPGDDDESSTEAQRLVQELADVRKRMQLRAEQPPLRGSSASGAYRAVHLPPVTAVVAKTDATRDSRNSPPPDRESETKQPSSEQMKTGKDAKDGKAATAKDAAVPDDAPPTRRRRL
jgi:hypothetical protein